MTDYPNIEDFPLNIFLNIYPIKPYLDNLLSLSIVERDFYISVDEIITQVIESTCMSMDSEAMLEELVNHYAFIIGARSENVFLAISEFIYVAGKYFSDYFKNLRLFALDDVVYYRLEGILSNSVIVMSREDPQSFYYNMSF